MVFDWEFRIPNFAHTKVQTNTDMLTLTMEVPQEDWLHPLVYQVQAAKGLYV